MREQTELRRQEQTRQSFGQRLQEKTTQNNELIFEPKSRSSYDIHRMRNFEIVKGRRYSQDNNNHNRHLHYQHHCIKMKIILRIIWNFWDSQTVDCLKYQLFLRNIRFKAEDKMKGKDYKTVFTRFSSR